MDFDVKNPETEERLMLNWFVLICYMHFKKPNRADYSEMTEDEMIIRYEKDEIIGMTVLKASKR